MMNYTPEYMHCEHHIRGHLEVTTKCAAAQHVYNIYVLSHLQRRHRGCIPRLYISRSRQLNIYIGDSQSKRDGEEGEFKRFHVLHSSFPFYFALSLRYVGIHTYIQTFIFIHVV